MFENSDTQFEMLLSLHVDVTTPHHTFPSFAQWVDMDKNWKAGCTETFMHFAHLHHCSKALAGCRYVAWHVNRALCTFITEMLCLVHQAQTLREFTPSSKSLGVIKFFFSKFGAVSLTAVCLEKLRALKRSCTFPLRHGVQAGMHSWCWCLCFLLRLLLWQKVELNACLLGAH